MDLLTFRPDTRILEEKCRCLCNRIFHDLHDIRVYLIREWGLPRGLYARNLTDVPRWKNGSEQDDGKYCKSDQRKHFFEDSEGSYGSC